MLSLLLTNKLQRLDKDKKQLVAEFERVRKKTKIVSQEQRVRKFTQIIDIIELDNNGYFEEDPVIQSTFSQMILDQRYVSGLNLLLHC